MYTPLSRTALLLSLTFLLTACGDNFHPRDKEHLEWADIYIQRGIDSAAFEAYDNSHERVQYYNLDRVSKRRPPASTFKIMIALVAIETGIAPDQSLVIPYDGSPTTITAWKKDMDLTEAMRVSSEPYFRELIRRIGRPTMQSFLDSNRYGNMTLSDNLENSWHDGSLLISPDEQVGFMLGLYHDKLTFSNRTHRIVRNLLPTEDSLSRSDKPYKITYKTGLSLNDSTYDAWMVGFFEDSLNNAHPYFFANNFEMPISTPMDTVLKLRLQTTHEIFRSMGLL